MPSLVDLATATAALPAAQAAADALNLVPTAHLALIEREIKNTIGSVHNALNVRKAHPSFGYTKAGMTADLNRAIGLAQGYAILTGVGTTDSAGRTVLDALGIDVAALRNAIQAS